MINKLCDDCLRTLTYNLNQDEILLLSKMKSENIQTPQLSVDESRLITLIKSSPYKIRFSINKLLFAFLIDSVKVGSTKYFITENGIRLLELYKQDLSKLK